MKARELPPPEADLTDPLVSLTLPHSGDQVKQIVHAEGKAGAGSNVQLTLDYTPVGTAVGTSKSAVTTANAAGDWTTGVVGSESEPNSGTLRAFKIVSGDGGTRNRLTLTETPIIGELRGEGDVEEAFRLAGVRVESGSYDPAKGSRVVCMLTPFTDDTWQLAFPRAVAIAGTWLTAFCNPTAAPPPYTLWAFLLDAEGNVAAQHTRKIP